jgi:DNA repair protein RecN (Recombination protein N)
MLTELRISNFAVIDDLTLSFSRGLHVLTGETGAGKSIIVDAVALLMGGRASNDLIRAGAEEAAVEASLRLPDDSSFADRLRREGVLSAGDGELVIRRVLSRSGKNRAYLNGSLAAVHQLQAFGGTIIDIHGQHDQQSLLAARAQLDALDVFGRLLALRGAYAAQFAAWRARQRELDALIRLTDERRAREDLLRFQYDELAAARIVPGEEEQLAAERVRLRHAQRLGELAGDAYGLLYDAEPSVLGMVRSVEDRLKELGGIDPGAREWQELCRQAAVALKELSGCLREYRERLAHDPERLAELEDRHDLLQRLKKKYGGSVDAVLARLDELKREVEGLDEGDRYVSEARRLAEEAGRNASASAQRLSRARSKAAKMLETRVQQELSALRMGRTRFAVEVPPPTGDDPLGETGMDRVEFLFSANEGEPMLPLARVASGGELSRVMLALKTVLAESDRVPVLVFDEVDAGVGGAVAAVMGQRLRALAKYHQVFCITHLPQIAAYGDAHVVVEKSVVKSRTVTRVRSLNRSDREAELARMLGGLEITPAVRRTAAEMLDEAARR